ncbi:MAG: PP2C family protein-serine/threonine phosphatase [Mangrovibacterium sp.]
MALDSRIGGRKENQDSVGYSETRHGLLVVVCDGMGGAKGGKKASGLAVDTIINEIYNSDLIDKKELLVNAIAKANETIYLTSRSHAELSGMGTTVVALLIDENSATVAHAGDSRIYQIRNKRKVFRTFDHSMVFELVRRGTITEEQARLSAESNVILRAVGTKPEVDIEVSKELPYLKGDWFLLCSDGISGAIPEKELLKLGASGKDIKERLYLLTETVDQLGFTKGSKHDNLTAVILKLKSNSKLKPKMDKRSKIIIGIVSLLLIISLSVNYKQLSYSEEKPVLTSQQPDSVQIKEILKLKEEVELLENSQKEDLVQLNRIRNEFLNDLDKIFIIVKGSNMEESHKNEVTKIITASKEGLKAPSNK